MKGLLVLILLFGLAFSNEIKWDRDFSSASRIAKEENKPMLLFFSGSDWCPWCKRMDKKIFQNPGFIEEAGDVFVFVLVDFPIKEKLSEKIVEMNQDLMEKYDLEGLPFVVLLTPSGDLITKVGYLPIEGKKYALYLLGLLDDYDSVAKDLEKPENLNESSWEVLHQKAQNLGSANFEQKVILSGKRYCPTPYFYLLKYEELLKEGKVLSLEVKQIKDKIIDLDPKNVHGSRLKMAILDFEALAKVEMDPEKVIDPLVQYIELFGKKEKTHLWKIHLMISKYLFRKDRLNLGLKYAKKAFRFAPKIIRKEIIQVIHDFQLEIENRAKLSKSKF